jgi:hypothetical protein
MEVKMRTLFTKNTTLADMVKLLSACGCIEITRILILPSVVSVEWA